MLGGNHSASIEHVPISGAKLPVARPTLGTLSLHLPSGQQSVLTFWAACHRYDIEGNYVGRRADLKNVCLISMRTRQSQRDPIRQFVSPSPPPANAGREWCEWPVEDEFMSCSAPGGSSLAASGPEVEPRRGVEPELQGQVLAASRRQTHPATLDPLACGCCSPGKSGRAHPPIRGPLAWLPGTCYDKNDTRVSATTYRNNIQASF